MGGRPFFVVLYFAVSAADYRDGAGFCIERLFRSLNLVVFHLIYVYCNFMIPD
jgi:hypothetical protein